MQNRAGSPGHLGFERPVFAPGQVLGPADLGGLGEYTSEKFLALLKYLAGPGVAGGLTVKATSPAGARVRVEPGYAVDGRGQDLYLKESAEIDLSDLIRTVVQCSTDSVQRFELRIRAARGVQKQVAACGPWGLREGATIPVRVLEGVSFEVSAAAPQVKLARPGALAISRYLVRTATSPMAVAAAAKKMAVVAGTQLLAYDGITMAPTGESLTISDDTFYGLVATPDGTKLYLLTGGSVHLVDATAWQQATLPMEAYSITRLAISADGATMAFFDQKGSRLIVTRSGAAAATVQVRQDGPLAVGPDGRVYMAAGDELLVADSASGAVSRVPLWPGVADLAVSPDGAYLFAALRYMGAVGVVETAALKLTGAIAAGREPAQLLVHPAEPHLYALNHESENVSVLCLQTGRQVALLQGPTMMGHAAFDWCGRLWIPVVEGGGVLVLERPGAVAGATVPDAPDSLLLAQILVQRGQTVVEQIHIDNDPYGKRRLPSLTGLSRYVGP